MQNNVGLPSKCIAGGFSAGVVLLWWPLLVPGDSLSAWLSRGVAFTLTFELLLLGLRPLEHALWATRRGTRLRTRIDGVAQRIASDDTVRRLGSTAALAAVAVAVPAALIAAGLQEQPAKEPGKHRAAAPRVVRITKVVERPVKIERVVEEVAPVASAPAPVDTPSAPIRSKSAPKTKKQPATERQAPKQVAAPKTQTETPEDKDEASKPASGSSVHPQPQLG